MDPQLRNERPDESQILLAHEWISSVGGSENVFRELLREFPNADAMCLWNDEPGKFDRPIIESRLAHTRLRGRKALALALMPSVWKRVMLDDYDTVIASSHAFAHHLATRAVRTGRRGFAYVHTPARYVWAPEVEARGRLLAARLGSIPLRRIDRRSVDPRVSYAANSEFVRERISRSWGVESSVIYPPVEVDLIRSVDRWRDQVVGDEQAVLDGLPSEFILGASRLVDYKRLDLVIQLGDYLGIPVVIAGSGPQEAQLRELALSVSVPVHFTGRTSDAALYALYQAALLFVFPPVEDFGIMPVEAMAAGTPTLVNRVGGARESVLAANGGAEIDLDSGASEWVAAAHQAMSIDLGRGREDIGSFSVSRFHLQIGAWVGESGALGLTGS